MHCFRASGRAIDAFENMGKGTENGHGGRRRRSSLESRLLLTSRSSRLAAQFALLWAMTTLAQTVSRLESWNHVLARVCCATLKIRTKARRCIDTTLLLLPGADIVEIGQRSTRQSSLLLSLFTCYTISVILPPVSCVPTTVPRELSHATILHLI